LVKDADKFLPDGLDFRNAAIQRDYERSAKIESAGKIAITARGSSNLLDLPEGGSTVVSRER
jgi:hypothetical protein